MRNNKCERCGASPAPYFAEDYDPLTQRNRIMYLCTDCMFRLTRIHDLFLSGEDECGTRRLHKDVQDVK